MSSRQRLDSLVALWEDNRITDSQKTYLADLASEFARLNDAVVDLKIQGRKLLAASKNIVEILEPQS